MGREVIRTLVLPNLKIYADMVLQPAFGDEGDMAQRYDAEKCLEAIIVDPSQESTDLGREL